MHSSCLYLFAYRFGQDDMFPLDYMLGDYQRPAAHASDPTVHRRM